MEAAVENKDALIDAAVENPDVMQAALAEAATNDAVKEALIDQAKNDPDLAVQMLEQQLAAEP